MLRQRNTEILILKLLITVNFIIFNIGVLSLFIDLNTIKKDNSFLHHNYHQASWVYVSLRSASPFLQASLPIFSFPTTLTLASVLIHHFLLLQMLLKTEHFQDLFSEKIIESLIISSGDGLKRNVKFT